MCKSTFKSFFGEKPEGREMTNARLDGLRLLLLGSLTFLLLGVAFENATPGPMTDFKGLYYPAKTLLGDHSPYNESDVERIYRSDGIDHSSDTSFVREITTRFVYLPTSLPFTIFFSMLPWGPSHLLWMALSIAVLILAAFLVYNSGVNYDPVISGCLCGLVLAGGELIVITGNPAGIAISLGIVCFALSLAIKPHDTGLVWLYFILAGGVNRKRAWQTLLVTVFLCLPAVIWVWHIDPHWIQEMHSTLTEYSVRGGMNDPGPSSKGGHGLDMIVDMQVMFSFFRDDPRFYNTASYLISALLASVWAVVTLRCRPSPARTWLALAAVSALTMLPFYHRQLDTVLLLLTIPACAMLWAEGGLIGRLALLVTTAGLILSGFLPWIIFYAIIGNVHLPATKLANQIVIACRFFQPRSCCWP
jgi:hypothetical protein